ncbi:hypothetical protein Tco_1322756 [Tanacetum coccineum]
MGRPKPRADIEIGNQRQTPTIRRRQTEAEEQKMQHNKGRTKGLREGRSESIRMETGRRVVEWFAIFNQKRKIEQCKGERSCPLFSGNPPPHMSKKRERGRNNNHFTLAHKVVGLASPPVAEDRVTVHTRVFQFLRKLFLTSQVVQQLYLA